MQPLIAVSPLWDETRESIWMLPGYLENLQTAGAAPFILPFTNDQDVLGRLLENADGLLLTGGQDIHPGRYHQKIHKHCGTISRQRDMMDAFLLEYALRRDIPVLGICRGFQFLNVHLGGTLYQDLPSQFMGEIGHAQKPPYTNRTHRVDLSRGTPLSVVLRRDSIKVNSIHHQGICDLAPQLRINAVAEDGLIEAADMPGKRFVLGVQWHPEVHGYEDFCTRAIFTEFIMACGHH